VFSFFLEFSPTLPFKQNPTRKNNNNNNNKKKNPKEVRTEQAAFFAFFLFLFVQHQPIINIQLSSTRKRRAKEREGVGRTLSY
jgi:hypothetical protein